MLIVIDECLPKRVRKFLEGEEVYTVPQIGLAGAADGELLRELAAKGIDCFVTIDGNMEYQQVLKKQPFGTIVIRSHSNRYSDLLPLKEELQKAIGACGPGRILHLPL